MKIRSQASNTLPMDSGRFKLTDRELQIVQAAIEGMTICQTAHHLGFTSALTRLHLVHALRRTGSMDMCELVKQCLVEGLILPPDGLIFLAPEDIATSRYIAGNLAANEGTCPLTERQLEVIWGLATGIPIGEVAEMLGISVVTVRNDIQRARGAANAPDKIALVATCIVEGWIDLPPSRYTKCDPPS